jgi:transcription antitermination factor NusG
MSKEEKPKPRPGDRVRVTNGTFKDADGVAEEFDQDGMVVRFGEDATEPVAMEFGQIIPQALRVRIPKVWLEVIR